MNFTGRKVRTSALAGFSRPSELGKFLAPHSTGEAERRLHSGAFQTQQFFFDLQAAPVTGERAVRAHHSMAGNDDRHRVPVIGLAHGAECGRTSHFAGKLAVCTRGTVGDFAQDLPAGSLKGRSLEIQRAGKNAQRTAKVFLQLVGIGLKLRGRFGQNCAVAGVERLPAVEHELLQAFC
jgi:hypothetical protein